MPKRKKQPPAATPYLYHEEWRLPREVERAVNEHVGLQGRSMGRLQLYASGTFIFEHRSWPDEDRVMRASVPTDWVARYFDTGLWRGVLPAEQGGYQRKLTNNCVVCFSPQQWTDQDDGSVCVNAPFCWFLSHLDGRASMMLKRMTVGCNRFGATYVVLGNTLPFAKELAQREALRMLGVNP